MEIKTLDQTEIQSVSGGLAPFWVYAGAVVTVMALAEYADEIIQGYNDHRREY